MPALGRDWLARSSCTVVRERTVSPWKTGFGKRVSLMPRLATVVPSVVSCTDRPITRPSVKMLFTSGWPNSVPLQYSASMWIAAGLQVALLNHMLSASVTVRRISCSNTWPTLNSSNHRPAIGISP